MKRIQFLGLCLRKGIQNYEHKVRYKSEYLFRTRPRALEVVRAIEWPSTLSFISFTVYPPLRIIYVIFTLLV
jgi:hypothetical protein